MLVYPANVQYTADKGAHTKALQGSALKHTFFRKASSQPDEKSMICHTKHTPPHTDEQGYVKFKRDEDWCDTINNPMYKNNTFIKKKSRRCCDCSI